MSTTHRKAPAQPYWNEKHQRYELFVELPRGFDGRRRRKQVTGRTKTEVRKRADQVRAEVTTTGTASRDNITIAALMAEYLEQAQLSGDVRKSSMETYSRWSRLYVVPMLGNRKAASLTVADVQNWHRAMEKAGKSTGSRRSAHRVLRQALNHALRAGYVTRNVATIARPPKAAASKVEPLTPEQVADLLGAAEGWRYEALVYVLLGAGLRIAEALGLTWEAVDLDDGTLEVRAQVREYEGTGKVWEPTTKTGQRRVVALGPTTVRKLRSHRAAMIEERMALGAGAPGDDDVVFPNEFHEIGDRSNIARMLKDLGRQAGVEGVHPHRLRHTHVSLALDAGVPLEAISEQVGHASIRTTKDVYGALQDRGRRRVADAVDGALSG